MKILVVDGQGGGLGRELVGAVKAALPDCEVIAVGTNSIATAAMIKAGADAGATGENAVVYNAEMADAIIGPIGIAFANSLHGEISPKMAEAVSASGAWKILIPNNRCNVSVAGVSDMPMMKYIEETVEKLKAISY